MLKGLTVLQNYPRYRRMSRKEMRNERNLYAIMAIMETDSTAQVSQCFIPFSRQRSYEVSHHAPAQAIVEELQCLDLLQLFRTNIDGLVHLISFWL